MGDGIKGFLEVDQHDVVELRVVHSGVEFFVEVLNVAVNRHVSPETVLVRGENGVNSRGDAFANNGGNNSVVSVVDDQRSGVFCLKGGFLR